MRFCEEDAEYALYEINGEDYFRCPVSQVTDESCEMLTIYSFFKDGHLPQPGSLFDQDFRMIEALKIVAHEAHKAEEERWRKRTR